MHSSIVPHVAPSHSHRLFRHLSLAALLIGLVGSVFAQADQQDRRTRRGGDNTNNGGNGGGRGNFDPQQMQQQMLDRIREQFGITDDAEWKIISDRLTAVTEARRNAGGGIGGMFGGRGGPPPGGGRGGDTSAGGRRGGPGGNPEQDSLRQAVADNLPDAELKSRMARLRETRKANEEKLARAQEELRAVLSVRQEAVAVMFGLIP